MHNLLIGWKEVVISINTYNSFDLSHDGQTLIICDQNFKPDENSWGHGRVQAYRWDDSSNDWQQKGADLTGSQDGEHFGSNARVSSDGRTLAVSSLSYLGNVSTTVYVWDDSSESWMHHGDLSNVGIVGISGNGETIVVIGY